MNVYMYLCAIISPSALRYLAMLELLEVGTSWGISQTLYDVCCEFYLPISLKWNQGGTEQMNLRNLYLHPGTYSSIPRS
jgi:hypothetical protein